MWYRLDGRTTRATSVKDILRKSRAGLDIEIDEEPAAKYPTGERRRGGAYGTK
jgi:hypothetical protein